MSVRLGLHLGRSILRIVRPQQSLPTTCCLSSPTIIRNGSQQSIYNTFSQRLSTTLPPRRTAVTILSSHQRTITSTSYHTTRRGVSNKANPSENIESTRNNETPALPKVEASASTTNNTTTATLTTEYPHSSKVVLPESIIQSNHNNHKSHFLATFSNFTHAFIKYALTVTGASAALLLILDFTANRQMWNRLFWEFYAKHYVPLSPYQDLYTYANVDFFKKELTFQITEEPSNDIPVYQLLLHKDIYCLKQYCNELSTQCERLIERGVYYDELGNLDNESTSDVESLVAQLLRYNTEISSDILFFEVKSNKVFDWDYFNSLPEDSLTRQQMKKEHVKYLNELEAAWCFTTGYRIGMEHLLPLLEKLSTRLVYTKTKYEQKIRSPEFCSQLETARRMGLDLDTRWPLREYTEIPLREVDIIMTNTNYEIEKLTRNYITKPTELRTPSLANIQERRQKLGTLRSSRRPRYIPQQMRQFVSRAAEKRAEIVKEYEDYESQLKKDKDTRELVLAQREAQIKERFEYLKRKDLIQESYARVMQRLDEEKSGSASTIRAKTKLPLPAPRREISQEELNDLILKSQDKDDPDLVALQQLLIDQEASKNKLSNVGVDVEEDIEKNAKLDKTALEHQKIVRQASEAVASKTHSIREGLSRHNDDI